MAAAPTPRLTPEQYLEIERQAQAKSEYYRGQMHAMAGGSADHALIAVKLSAGLDTRLRGRGCLVFSSDLRLRVSPEGLYTYPDVTVVCGVPAFADERRDTLLNPALIAEVLSPSTEAQDRGFKFAQYRTLDSLREYVLVAQFEPRVECYLRQARGDWLLKEFVGLDAVCRLESLGIEIPLRELYENVQFGETLPGPVASGG